MTGNGYMVTWTFGNMLSLAMPKDYGMDRPERGRLPAESRPLQTDGKARQDRYGVGTRHQRGPPAESDRESIRRLRYVSSAATDASREGEMVFRYLYRYLDCQQALPPSYGSRHSRTKPCWRAWTNLRARQPV